MDFINLKSSLKSEGLKNSYLIEGNDSFLRDSAKNQLVRACNLQNSEMNLTVFDEDAEISQILACVQSYPFFDEKRVVIWRLPKKVETKMLFEYLDNQLSSTLFLMLSAEKTPIIHTYLEKINCSSENDDVVESWVFALCKSKNIEIETAALQTPCTFCKCDMGRISIEIEKLNLMCSGKISRKDVEENVFCDVTIIAYNLSNSLFGGEPLIILEEMLGHDASIIPLLISTLFNLFKRMYVIKTANANLDELTRLLGVKSYAVKMAKKQADCLTVEKIVYNMEIINKFDFMFKKGKMTAENAMRLIIIGLII